MRIQGSDDDREIYKYLKVLLKDRLDKGVCELCKKSAILKIHHTKYDGATLKDLLAICSSCNNKKENKYLN